MKTKLAPTPAAGKWFSLPELAEHSRLSVSTLKRAVAGTHGSKRLPSYLIGRRRLVKAADYETWVESYREPSARVEQAVASILAKLRR